MSSTPWGYIGKKSILIFLPYPLRMTVLYHSLPAPPEGDVLRPGTRNVAMVEADDGTLTAHAVEYAPDNVPYLYAADNLQLSATYALPKGIRLGNMHGHGGAEILFIDQESVIGDPDLTGRVYQFESDHFHQLHIDGKPSDQWVSDKGIDTQSADYLPIQSLNDIMRTGVQIYQLGENEKYTANDLYEDMVSSNMDESFLNKVKALQEEGKLRWVNEERGIHPVSCLEKPLSLGCPAATINASPKREI